ncbi:MAG: hypothetical protein IT370_10750 [Deltaproteobacteria bacterium]|nr:hypothetical protein [Deltaproteobacteria bacterium]
MTQTPKKRPPKRPPRPLPRGAPTKSEESSPEIQVGFAPVGRETLAAITTNVAPKAEGPELEFHLVPAGRETLAAITAELVPPSGRISHGDGTDEPTTGVRQRQRTHGYSEPPPQALSESPRMTMPGVAPPANAPPKAKAERVSKDTIDALASAMLEVAPSPPSARSRAQALEVFELVTFVIKGDDLGQLSTEATRREFVVERLMHRLPIATVDQIDRVDLTPWTVRGTVILRVWCKVRSPLR